MIALGHSMETSLDKYAFCIQASRPRVGPPDDSDETLGDVIETIFPLDAECAYLVWDRIHIPLSYRYDVGTIIDDVLELIERVATAEAGTLTIVWPSNTFAAIWSLSWTAERVDIVADWRDVCGFVTDLLRARPTVAVARTAFLAEWAQLLTVLVDAMVEAGLAQHPGCERLRRALAMLPRPGRLYR